MIGVAIGCVDASTFLQTVQEGYDPRVRPWYKAGLLEQTWENRFFIPLHFNVLCAAQMDEVLECDHRQWGGLLRYGYSWPNICSI